MILINGQWQGGGKLDTYEAARQLGNYFGLSSRAVTLPVSTDANLTEEDGIVGSRVIQEQIQAALTILKNKKPPRLMTVGGGCDADVASIAYMNERYQGDLSVVWMDAHGDINSPAESASHLFYGMPLRALLGDCPPISELISRKLKPEQIALVGSRELDSSETQYIEKNNISRIPVLSSSADLRKKLSDVLKSQNKRHIYIHLDLDVLDPNDFPDTPLPASGAGYSPDVILSSLRLLRENYDVVGTGIFEWKYRESVPEFLKSAVAILSL
ncbi:MAG: arginase family protein [Lachnospiraceae bacterium]|jgi:arginase